MNIAHLLPASAVFPLKKHNGRYEWALRLARHQVQQGHTVTVYAGAASHDPISPSIIWRSLAAPDDMSPPNDQLINQALVTSTHDIFHSHFDYLAFRYAHITTRPVITTQHWFPDQTIARHIRAYPSKNAFAVPVTRHMHKVDHTLGIPSSSVIYHGIDLSLFAASYAPRSERYACVGRIAPHKGTLETVKLAYEADLELDIIGKINQKDEPYWQTIRQYVDGKRIKYLGQLPQDSVARIMRRARALIFTPQHVEAFGQTIIEAQACGTPIITTDIGANSELVLGGTTGFVCRSNQELRDAVAAVAQLDPRKCRQFAAQFNINTMVQSYDRLYRASLQKALD